MCFRLGSLLMISKKAGKSTLLRLELPANNMFEVKQNNNKKTTTTMS